MKYWRDGQRCPRQEKSGTHNDQHGGYDVPNRLGRHINGCLQDSGHRARHAYDPFSHDDEREETDTFDKMGMLETDDSPDAGDGDDGQGFDDDHDIPVRSWDE